MAADPAFAATPKRGKQQIANADASTFKSLLSAGSSGTKVFGITLQSTDTSARVVQISLYDGTTDFLIGSVTVAAGAGNDGLTPSQPGFDPSLLASLPKDNDGNPYVLLQSGDSIRISSTTTVTSGKTINATAQAADF